MKRLGLIIGIVSLISLNAFSAEQTYKITIHCQCEVTLEDLSFKTISWVEGTQSQATAENAKDCKLEKGMTGKVLEGCAFAKGNAQFNCGQNAIDHGYLPIINSPMVIPSSCLGTITQNKGE